MTFGGFCHGVGVGRNRAPTPKVGVWPLKRQAQWKSTLLYFRGWQLGMGVWTADSCPKANSPPLRVSGQELFQVKRGGSLQKQRSQLRRSS